MRRVRMTRRTALFSFAGVIVIGLFVAGNVGRSLRADLTLDRQSYEVGEPIEFTLTVCSNSVLPMTTEDGKPSWQIFDAAGDVVADSSHYIFTLELKNLTWGPRSCRTGVSESWDQRVWNQPTAFPEGQLVDGPPVRGEAVGPGTYRLEVKWGWLDPVTTTFEIRS
ncbi:hypothetical protein BH23ACT2_BH23ACT2_11750 [soil metagenome]